MAKIEHYYTGDKHEDSVTINATDFAVKVTQNDQGIIVDTWVRDGDLIDTQTFWRDDFFEPKETEEDLLKKLQQGGTVKATDFARSMGISVTEIK